MSEENQEVQHHQVDDESRVPAEERYCMIAEAAYFIAERSGFEGDCEAYWLAAECEIDRMLGDETVDSPFISD